MKPILIANPVAGKKLQSFSSLHETLGDWVPESAPIEVTQYAGHAEQIARDACKRGFDTLIALGGDGTIHEILNGILTSQVPGVRLGIYPIGTANDYAFTLRKERSKHDPFSRRVDIGRATCNGRQRFFINVAGLGLPGRVADLARGMKRLPARVRYTLALMRSMGAKYRTHPLRAFRGSNDAREVESALKEFLMISVAIGIREGSYPLNPNAIVDDGLFDVLEVGALRRRDIVRYFPRILKGDIPTDDPRITTGRSESYLIECEHPVPFHLDGEAFHIGEDRDLLANGQFSRFRLQLEVLHQALAVELLR